MDSLISIIIPVYNVEKYLRRCIDSVLGQTYDKLEIILVDDGSTDNSGRICDEYREKDQRIIVIHKENGGLSEARNFGIEKSSGEYISFVDSDDWIPEDSVAIMYCKMKEYNAEIVSGIVEEVFVDRISNKVTNEVVNSVEYTSEQALEKLLYLHGFSNSASGKIYQKRLFDKIKFPINKHYEDLGTTYKIFANAKKVIFIDKIVYFYFQNSNSITHLEYTPKRLEAVAFAKEALSFVGKKYPRIEKAAIFRLFFETLSCISDMPFFAKKEELYSIIKKYRHSVVSDNNLYFKQKLICLSSYFGTIGIKIAFRARVMRKKRRSI